MIWWRGLCCKPRRAHGARKYFQFSTPTAPRLTAVTAYQCKPLTLAGKVRLRYIAISNIRYSAGKEFQCDQSLKDKAFRFQVRTLQEDYWLPKPRKPFRDLAGTGLFSSEFVSRQQKVFNDLDFRPGVAWGYIGNRGDFRNPLGINWQRLRQPGWRLQSAPAVTSVSTTTSGGRPGSFAWWNIDAMGPTAFSRSSWNGKRLQSAPAETTRTKTRHQHGCGLPPNQRIDLSVSLDAAIPPCSDITLHPT